MLEWDFSTVTAGDFTVEFTIPESAYLDWYDNEYKADGGDAEADIAPAMSLKNNLKSIIESTLT